MPNENGSKMTCDNCKSTERIAWERIGDQWLCRVCKALWVEIEFHKMAEILKPA
jgi:rubredoxin